MEEEGNNFFKWTGRISSVLFLLLLVLSIGIVIFGIYESNNWNKRNSVEITGKNPNKPIENLHLGRITKVCGKDIQYVPLTSDSNSKGFSSGGYGNITRNVVFFVGEEMNAHWLFNTDSYLIDKIQQIKKNHIECKNEETLSIYFEIRKKDADNNGKLDNNDPITIALTSPDGLNYTEIEQDLTSVLDHSINYNTSVLTLLVQHKKLILMKKYSLKTNKKLSEKEITRIAKKQ
ncbi:MAG: hypothetical protein KAJ63_00120 [Methyloprofundus sp.]|nr:hypothetical protein [Methyloprofundus sp.]